jgi:D-aminopeptidase
VIGERVGARKLGIRIGRFKRGRYNAITDVKGVLVGHATILLGRGPRRVGRGPVRTGVTAILPRAGNVFENRVVGGAFVLNGAGEVSGLTQVTEWGLIETPIVLTNTHSVGDCSSAVVDYMVETYPSVLEAEDVIIPVVGECDDSWLNDTAGRHVTAEHVRAAIRDADGGRVAEGSVGGGTGMMTCGFKAGIGTSSRRLGDADGGYTIGVLVMSNFGMRADLRIGGIPIGRILAPDYAHLETRTANYGSIIAVVATNAPLHTHQLGRLAKRAALGVGRVGSYAAHNSGEIVVAFSTANDVPRTARRMEYRMRVLLDQRMDPLYEATVDATEEAILNALCMADDMDGADDHFAPALPIQRVRDLIRKSNRCWFNGCAAPPPPPEPPPEPPSGDGADS